MKRRNFLKLLGMTAVGAMVPTALIEKPAPVEEYPQAPRGLMSYINSGWDGTYGTIERDMFPTMASPALHAQ